MLCHGVKWIPNIWEVLHAEEENMPWPNYIRKTVRIENNNYFSAAASWLMVHAHHYTIHLYFVKRVYINPIKAR